MSDADDELDRKAILARRRRFMAVALTGLAGTTLAATACPCLKVGPPPDDPGPDTSPPTTDGTNETEGATESDGQSDEGDAERLDRRQDDGDSLEEAQPGV